MLKRAVTLYFVRHGETDWNAVRRYQGQTRHSAQRQGARAGRAQRAHPARIARPDVAHVDFVASPLMRTTETMMIVRREMGLIPDDFRRDDRLKEINFGHWEGRIWDVLPDEDPVAFQARRSDPFNWRPIGGESYADLAERVRGWLAEINQDTVVVSHGGVSRVVRGHVLALEVAAIPLLDVPQDKVLLLTFDKSEWA